MEKPASQSHSALEQQLLDECRAMAQYALSQGLPIPALLADKLENYDGQASGRASENAEIPSATDNGAVFTTALAASPPPTNLSKHHSLQSLILLHSRLARIIAPVKPHVAVIMVDHTSSRKFFKFLGPIPLIQHMMLISILSLAGMFAAGLSDAVDGNPKNFSLLLNNGESLLFNELFLLFAASIGASFNALFVADNYAREGVWNPSYETSYWIRYVLGLLSGTILATLVPIETIDPTTNAGSLNGFGGPILALLGGFSSNVVYRILARLAENLESLVSGGAKEKIAAQEKTANLRVIEQTARERMLVSARLAKLQSQLHASADPNLLKEELDRLQHELLAPRPEDDFPEMSRSAVDG